MRARKRYFYNAISLFIASIVAPAFFIIKSINDPRVDSIGKSVGIGIFLFFFFNFIGVIFYSIYLDDKKQEELYLRKIKSLEESLKKEREKNKENY